MRGVFSDFEQDIDRCSGRIELTSTVVGDKDPVCSFLIC